MSVMFSLFTNTIFASDDSERKSLFDLKEREPVFSEQLEIETIKGNLMLFYSWLDPILEEYVTNSFDSIKEYYEAGLRSLSLSIFRTFKAMILYDDSGHRFLLYINGWNTYNFRGGNIVRLQDGDTRYGRFIISASGELSEIREIHQEGGSSEGCIIL
jgi:hypothetical protein